MVGVLVNNDAQARDLAQFHLSKRALPLDRVEQIEVAAYRTEANLAMALNLDLLDIISVRRTAPNWTADLTLAVSGIRHQITLADWRVTVTTQNDLTRPGGLHDRHFRPRRTRPAPLGDECQSFDSRPASIRHCRQN
jgi:hypothetical protein